MNTSNSSIWKPELTFGFRKKKKPIIKSYKQKVTIKKQHERGR